MALVFDANRAALVATAQAKIAEQAKQQSSD
jgi:hypothetical protein